MLTCILVLYQLSTFMSVRVFKAYIFVFCQINCLLGQNNIYKTYQSTFKLRLVTKKKFEPVYQFIYASDF